MSIPDIIIKKQDSLEMALIKLDANPQVQTLLIEENQKIIGSLTDGDIRRGLIKGLDKRNIVQDFMNSSFTFLTAGTYEPKKIETIKKLQLKIVPELHADGSLKRIINFKHVKTILPIDAVIMAGGKGTRLLPLTENTPKPMLKIGDKPIMEYNLELLQKYGITHLNISVKYLAEQIETYFGDGHERDMEIRYVYESKALGTIGAVKQVQQFYNDYILVMNSDLLTNINLELMYNELLEYDADMICATTDYKIQIPYGVVEAEGNRITALKEKPTYTYYSNAGIYIFKKSMVDIIPSETFYNATDLLETLIKDNKRVLHFPIKNYWLDIGKHVDFERAQKDIKNISL
ncbi:MAG: nucleotidyltransferase family protein [Putridiphycobacter sp.]|nr:nucleotidyltransferase family protein [Putridiphycobacter sp.]